MIKSKFLLIILFLFFGNQIISQRKKVPAPDGNDYYHTYEKKNNSVHIYDSSNHLVREAHVNKNLAYDFFSKDILLNYLGKTGYISDQIFFSKKRINYLTSSMERENFIASELGFQEKYEINKIGLTRLVSSTQYFENQPPPPTSDPNEKLTKEELELIKFNEENKDSIAYLHRLEKNFDKENQIYNYIQYEQGSKVLELYFKFNEQDLVSNTLAISTFGSNTPEESKGVIYKKGKSDNKGNLIELMEFTTKNPKQFDELISNKGEAFFLKVFFEDTENYFKFTPVKTDNYKHNKQQLTCWKTVFHYSGDELLERKYKYDKKERLIEINTTKDNKPYEIDTYNYE